MRVKLHLLILATFLAALSFSCNGPALGPAPGPGQTERDFFRYVETGNIDAALKLMSKSLINKAGGLDKAKEFLTTWSNELKRHDYYSEYIQIKKESIVDEVAELDVEIKYRNETAGPITIHSRLTKEDGEWKIDVIGLGEFSSK